MPRYFGENRDMMGEPYRLLTQEYPKTAAKTTLIIGSMIFPVEDAFLSWAAAKGYSIITRAGKRLLTKGGAQVAETEAKALIREYRVARAQQNLVDYSKELTRDRGNATRSLRNALNTNSAVERPHHIITWEMKDHPVVQAAARGGFNINGANNGINLPLTVHPQGARHPRYNAAIGQLLDNLKSLNLTDVETAVEVQTLVDRLRPGLSRLIQTRQPLR
jgi:hypothetical protein